MTQVPTPYDKPRRIITKADAQTATLKGTDFETGTSHWESTLMEGARVYQKASRVLAVQMQMPFRVETDQGWMDGETGDWLVTNHPEDDPGSDMWPVSAERFAATYRPAS